MDPIRKILKKGTKKFVNKVINLINDRRMFNVETVDLAIKPYFSHKTLLQ